MPEPTTPASQPDDAASTFDDQAPQYDGRAGLPPLMSNRVAEAIASLGPLGPDDLVVELGAGTGEIGLQLARLPLRYLGLDVSAPMLEQFRAKAPALASSLLLADCNRAWPVPTGDATVVFGSRVIHLLDPEHVTRETLRVGRPQGFLVIGRVLRDPDSTRERLRRHRQDLLKAAGLGPRNGAAGTRRVIDLCERAGASSLGRQVVAEWESTTTAAGIIAGWASLTRMGSVPLAPEIRAGIIKEVQDWARIEIGDLDRPEVFRERYAIDVVRLP